MEASILEKEYFFQFDDALLNPFITVVYLKLKVSSDIKGCIQPAQGSIGTGNIYSWSHGIFNLQSNHRQHFTMPYIYMFVKAAMLIDSCHAQLT